MFNYKLVQYTFDEFSNSFFSKSEFQMKEILFEIFDILLHTEYSRFWCHHAFRLYSIKRRPTDILAAKL